MEIDFYEKLEKFDVQAGKKDKIFSDHVTQVCEAHDRAILSYLQQIHGSPGADVRELRKHWAKCVCVGGRRRTHGTRLRGR